MKHNGLHCDICAEIGGKVSTFSKLHPNVSSRVILETETFRVTPTIRPLSHGHILIWTKEHAKSFSCLCRKEINELDSLINYMIDSCIIPTSCVHFEHGVNEASVQSCGVDHAHMHIAPLSWNDTIFISETENFHSYNILHQVSHYKSYIFCEIYEQNFVIGINGSKK